MGGQRRAGGAGTESGEKEEQGMRFLRISEWRCGAPAAHNPITAARAPRLQILICSFAALVIFAAISRAAPAAKPNIILILADDLGWADLGCYGNTFNETPNIDRLAREGVRFTQFYAGPVCSPTRASIQSGQNQARLGITVHIPGHWKPFAKMVEPPVALNLPLEIETFAERLGAVGYKTGYFGKWHLGEAGYGPAEQGWQTAIETQGNVVPERVAPGGRRTAEFLTEKAVGFIEANKAQPFLLQVSHFAVHIPLSTTAELLKKYQAKSPMPNYPSRPAYAGLLEELDQSVGRIAARIDQLGLGANTLIIFVSDNGGLQREQGGTLTTSNAPLRGEKGSLYEGGIRVPCIARWPGVIAAAKTSATVGTTIDFYPTFLALASGMGVSPMNPNPEHGRDARATQILDGVDLMPVLRKPTATLNRDALYWHLPHYHHSTPSTAMRQGDWKLIEFLEDGALELYNLRDDLSETSNLAAKFPDRTKAMYAALKAWRKEVQAQMPQRNPAYDPAREGEFWSRKTVTPTRAAGGEGDGAAKKGKRK
jgi:arylsulfatase A